MDNAGRQNRANPPCSPDISPCDCCLFGALKQIMKAIECKFWDHLNFDEVQHVFEACIARFEWVIANGREYFIQ
jgi:hypothetical protein